MIHPDRLPKHVAIIMDGNGRWAKRRGLPRLAGHRQGVESLREVTRACGDLGIGILTVFAFSTENWERPKEEVEYLLNLLDEVLEKELPELHPNGVRVRIIGRRGPAAPTCKKIEAAEAHDRRKTEAPAQRRLQLRRTGGDRRRRKLAVAGPAEGELREAEIDEHGCPKRCIPRACPIPTL